MFWCRGRDQSSKCDHFAATKTPSDTIEGHDGYHEFLTSQANILEGFAIVCGLSHRIKYENADTSVQLAMVPVRINNTSPKSIIGDSDNSFTLRSRASSHLLFGILSSEMTSRKTMQYLTLAAMFTFVAWFLWAPASKTWSFNWEPIAGFFLALATYVRLKSGEEIPIEDGGAAKPNPADVALFEELRAVLPSNGAIEFLRQHDFLIDFDDQHIDPLRTFEYEWDDAEHEFFDPRLEGIRKSLFDAVLEFRGAVAQFTVGQANGLRGVRVQALRHNPIHEARFREEATVINNAAKPVIDFHQKLMRTGRRILGAAR